MIQFLSFEASCPPHRLTVLACNYLTPDPKYDDIKTQDCFSYPLTSYSTIGRNISLMYGILTTPITEILHYQQHSKVKGVRLVIRSLNVYLPYGLFTLQGKMEPVQGGGVV